MSDRIKKIKVKKSDGTFSDYIPIGADAKNIDTIDGESVELKLNKKPYYYNNVADMKADTKLKIGDMAITLGYYEANDGGNGTYKIVNDDNLIDNGGSIHNLNNGLKAKLIIENKINIKQFGAKGDGISDDTIKIQNAIDFGFSKGIDVYVPATDDYFLTTLPLILVAYNSKHPISYWDGNGCKLIGESKSKSRIVKIGHESLQDKNSTLLCFTSENEKSTGIIIDNLSIEHYDDTNLNKTIGNCIDINISRSQLSNLNIIGFNGINAKIFSSTFENIVFNCVEDALISKGGTSNLYRFLYAPQCKNAYTISSQYSSLINVCGDNCKGTLFKLGGMGLSLINCGCESPELENIFDIITDYTTLNIDNFCSVRQTGIENELNLEDCSVVKISSPIHVSIAINIDSFSIIENKLINGTSYFFNPLYTDSPYNHKIYTLIKNLRYYKNFSGGTNEKIKLWKTSSTVSQNYIDNDGIFNYINMNNGTILPFLGIGDYKNITENEMPKKKILLDVNTKYKNSKNVNFANYINPNIGDIELYNNPKTMNALGLSIVETDLSPGNVSWKACEIPLNLVGSTTDRPTENLFKGLQYFDTTLNKPIYWTGTKWIDATGTAV